MSPSNEPDSAARNLVDVTWTCLRAGDRNLHELDAQVFRLVKRALEAFHEDAAVFGTESPQKHEDVLDRLRARRTYREMMAEVRKQSPRAYKLWTPEEDHLVVLAWDGSHDEQHRIATDLRRQPSAITSRFNKLIVSRELESRSDSELVEGKVLAKLHNGQAF
jgi:hypothetical protein